MRGVLEPLPPGFAATRDALHALAEHVLAASRYRHEQRIGLTPTPGGFGTPPFDNGERVRVEGVELVHERPRSARRAPITTLADAAGFVGVPLGAPVHVYTPVTPCRPDALLAVDAAAVAVLAVWFDYAATLLGELRDAYSGHAPSFVQLWPEHFDLGVDFGDEDAGTRANYGASPGDDAIAEPYLYVGPWDERRRVGALGTHEFGAAVTYGELRAASDPRGAGRDFLFGRAALLLGSP